MSGGSFDYLTYASDLEDLLAKRSQLQDMADALAGLEYARDAAMETEGLIRDLRSFSVRVEVALKRLTPVWKAVEWWCSSDWSEDQVKEALASYRGQSAT